VARASSAETVIAGWRAALAALRARPDTVVRVLVAPDRAREIGPLLADLARRRVAYRVAGDDDLARVTATRAHQGIAVVVRRDPPRAATPAEVRSWARAGMVVALDGVGNPHNLGAIARTAAFFGARALIVAGANARAVGSTAALRVAEGALDAIEVRVCGDLAALLRDWRAAGGAAVALDPSASVGLDRFAPPAGGGLCVVAGAEEDGLSPAVRAACGHAVRVVGSGAVESLNVGVAVGVALADLRQRVAPPT